MRYFFLAWNWMCGVPMVEMVVERTIMYEMLKLTSKTSKSDTSTGSWGLVHLTENKGDLGVTVKLNDGCLLHFVVQIVALTSTLTDTGEDRVTTVSLGNVVLEVLLAIFLAYYQNLVNPYDQLLNEHSLSDTSTAEQSNLTTTGVRSEQVDDLDTSDENFGGGGLFSEGWGVGVDGLAEIGLDGTTLVNWVTSDVHDTTKSSGTDRNHDGTTSVSGSVTTDETLST